MIKVWADGVGSGLLESSRDGGSVFAYTPGLDVDRAVSVTMPVRLASWNWQNGIAPIFEMNLPEGVLREQLRLRFAKAAGAFSDLDLLAVVGRSQMGRVRYSGVTGNLTDEVPFQSVDNILSERRDGDLMRYLLDKFAQYSGVSGIQPKVLIRDIQASGKLSKDKSTRQSQSFRGATHIVKLWDRFEYPELAANEYFCLSVARRCALEVPNFQLTANGDALVVERFDITEEGKYLGFEDFCVLNGRSTKDKYRGSYESSIVKRFSDFAVSSAKYNDDMKNLFTLIVLNFVLRNGDAHLKNFGILYSSVNGDVSLAPVYDIVTTTAYIPQDRLALTLAGSTHWPAAKRLTRFGNEKMQIGIKDIGEIFSRISDAVADTRAEVESYAMVRPEFKEVASRMLKEWDAGVAQSLTSNKTIA